MSQREAREYLAQYLALERQGIEEMREQATHRGCHLDYSIASVAPVFRWLMGGATFRRIPVPKEEPEWIRQSHDQGLVEFAEHTKVLILRASFYLGEAFVCSFATLSWDIGQHGYMEQNTPVIRGFGDRSQMPTLVVGENLFASVLADGNDHCLERAIAAWANKVSQVRGQA